MIQAKCGIPNCGNEANFEDEDQLCCRSGWWLDLEYKGRLVHQVCPAHEVMWNGKDFEVIK